MLVYETLLKTWLQGKGFSPHIPISISSANYCLIMVEGFVRPRDPRGNVVGCFWPPGRVSDDKLVLGEGLGDSKLLLMKHLGNLS